jgi:solute carrier family 25 (mitochondrial iron transporter), member 28/37
MADLDWEDWDPSQGKFTHHMIAGSLAGITEHTIMFPVDTIKTYVQCMRECPERQAGKHVMELIRGEGMLRLWRGVGTMFMGCVPAHAAYFSVLEHCKHKFGANAAGHQPIAAAAAGGLATVFHDAVMTPMDVIKQRLQLGYYRGIGDCVRTIYATEGLSALYRSFPTTLFMNIPYGCVMVAANESIKVVLRPNDDHDVGTYMIAGCGAGAIAAAATTPLDVVKTRLQTQALHMHTVARPQAAAAQSSSTAAAPSAGRHFSAAAGSPLSRWRGSGGGRPPGSSAAAAAAPAIFHSNAAGRCMQGCGEKPLVTLQYQGLADAVRQISAAEGYRGFFRGLVPRLLVHMPSVAISWTTYETVKTWLQDSEQQPAKR